MIKSTLIANIASKMTHLSEKNVADNVNHLLALMSEALVQGQRIEIRGFGSFTSTYRSSRQAHNPKTGEKVVTVPKFTSHFKPGKNLRERIQASREVFALVPDTETVD